MAQGAEGAGDQSGHDAGGNETVKYGNFLYIFRFKFSGLLN